ncbi:porin family protein [Confluentibacter citreus]|uniref:porin family protein n=1 Tax=Confluentibacter citreus TaxID=2007307 RepID=UPI000C29270E|nr:porin family protein [Confluentibacter citreus]
MKRLILLTILLGFPIFGFCQDDNTEKKVSNTNASGSKTPSFQGIIYGVRGGYNISNLDFTGIPFMENKHRNSFYFGTFADIALSNIISLVPELQFSAEGAKDEKLHLDYIQAPIFLKFKLNKRIRFGIAPQVGWKVYKFNDGIKDIALSGVAGFEYKINEVLFIDARYTYGVTNIFHEDLGIEAKNTNIQIGIGHQF